MLKKYPIYIKFYVDRVFFNIKFLQGKNFKEISILNLVVFKVIIK